MNFLKNNVCSLFFLPTKIVTATLRALWRLNQKSSVKFAQIEKMCHFTFYTFVFEQIFCQFNSSGAMNFLKNNVCSLFFLYTKIVTATLQALWRLNQKSLAKFAQIEKMCHFTFYNFVFMQIFCRCNR